MFNDVFYYRPKFNPFFRSLCMKFEDDPDPDPDPGGGGGGEHWLDNPNYEDLKDNQYLRRFKTEAEAHKGHFETKQALSDPLRLPKTLGKATDEQITDYRARVGKLLGAPDNEDGYEIKRPNLPEGTPYDEDGEKMVRTWGLKHHLSQSAVQEAMDMWNQTMLARGETLAKDNEAAVKETITKLEEDLGKSETKESLVLIERLMRGYVNPDWQNVEEDKDEAWQDFKKKIYLSGIGNNFVLMKILSDAAPLLVGEGKIIGGSPPSTETKDEDLSEKEKQKKYFPKSEGMVD